MRIEITVKVFEDDSKKPNTRMIESTEAFSIKPEMPQGALLIDAVMHKTNAEIIEAVCGALGKIQRDVGQITRAERLNSQL